MRSPLLALALLVPAVLGACAHTVNYPDPSGPRYAGRFAPADDPAAAAAADRPGAAGRSDRRLRVVTFNIKFARRIDLALILLSQDTRLKDADVICLQEMDARGTELIARGLHLNYVYYPAFLHPTDGRDLGEAVLSPWPIEADRKIILPHLGRLRRSLRIAVGATVRIRGEPVRAYCLHLATTFELNGAERADQARAVLSAAAQDPGRVIIAGDLNGPGLGALFRAEDFDWPTRRLGPTFGVFAIDHIFLRGFPGPARGGAVKENLGASDHRPVWVEFDERVGDSSGASGERDFSSPFCTVVETARSP